MKNKKEDTKTEKTCIDKKEMFDGFADGACDKDKDLEEKATIILPSGAMVSASIGELAKGVDLNPSKHGGIVKVYAFPVGSKDFNDFVTDHLKKKDNESGPVELFDSMSEIAKRGTLNETKKEHIDSINGNNKAHLEEIKRRHVWHADLIGVKYRGLSRTDYKKAKKLKRSYQSEMGLIDSLIDIYGHNEFIRSHQISAAAYSDLLKELTGGLPFAKGYPKKEKKAQKDGESNEFSKEFTDKVNGMRFCAWIPQAWKDKETGQVSASIIFSTPSGHGNYFGERIFSADTIQELEAKILDYIS